MRILPKSGDTAHDRFLIWTRLIVGLAVCIFGVLTQFNVTINQSVEKPKIVRVISASNPTPVEKSGELTDGECYAIAKDPDKWTKRKLLDTFGTPEDYDGGNLYYPLKGESKRKLMNCRISILDQKIDGISIDLYSDLF